LFVVLVVEKREIMAKKLISEIKAIY